MNNVTVLSALTLSGINGTVPPFSTGGDGIVLSTPGKFINNAGATALFLPGGARFLIYSADPANGCVRRAEDAQSGHLRRQLSHRRHRHRQPLYFLGRQFHQHRFLGGAPPVTGTASTAAAPALAAFIAGCNRHRDRQRGSASATATGAAAARRQRSPHRAAVR